MHPSELMNAALAAAFTARSEGFPGLSDAFLLLARDCSAEAQALDSVFSPDIPQTNPSGHSHPILSLPPTNCAPWLTSAGVGRGNSRETDA